MDRFAGKSALVTGNDLNHGQKPAENVPSRPPLIVVEIVSRDDRYTKILEKLGDYHASGVPHIWLIDPWQRKLSTYGPEGLTAVSALHVPELDLTASLTELFD